MRDNKRKRGHGKQAGLKNAAGGEGPSPMAISALTTSEFSDPEPEAAISAPAAPEFSDLEPIPQKEYVVVVWDMENCNIPLQCQIRDIFQNMKNIIRKNVRFHIIGDPAVINENVCAEIIATEPTANIFLTNSGKN